MAFIYDLTDTWNAGGTTFNAIKMNVTDTASAAASKLITVQVSGSEKFSVKKDGVGYFAGNVGIGTSSPSAKLEVAGSIFANTGNISLTDAYSVRWGNTYLYGYNASFMAFVTANNERLRITSAGDVGIGTTSPSALLDVAGDAEINGLTVGLGGGGETTNTAYGIDALSLNTTGGNNTASGFRALYSNTTGNNNTASGYEALYSNTTGNSNTAFGHRALYLNTEGAQNTALGYQTLYSNTTGGNNTASGLQALQSNTTGDNNTAYGHRALYSNTEGAQNTASGRDALYFNTTGNNNTASGHQALYSNTTGSNSTASGRGALFSNTTGISNTASGRDALYSNTTGSSNAASGYHALYSNTTGSNNTASGLQALQSNTTGGSNTASGRQALSSNTTGNNNTASGYLAGNDNTEGTRNTYIGYNTGRGITTGNYNTIVGSGVTGLSASLSNNVIIADGQGNRRINIDSSGNVAIGGTSPNAKLHISGAASSTYTRIDNTNGVFYCGVKSTGEGYVSTESSDPLTFATVGIERLRITSAGSVGIGTSSPDSAALLDVVSSDGKYIRTKATAADSTTGYILANDARTWVIRANGSNSDALEFRNATSGRQEMIIDISGRVGIGTTSPDKALTISASDSQIRLYDADGTNQSASFQSDNGTTKITSRNNTSDGAIAFQRYDGTTVSESMRISSAGDLLVGTTSSTIGGAGMKTAIVSDTIYGVGISCPASGSPQAMRFAYGTTAVGSIVLGASSTTYNTSSDARLKENIADADDAANLIDAIQVRKFDWKADGSHQRYGMVAQELLEVAPEAVSGEPEGEDMMGVDYSKLVPMLIKEIQSLRARVAQLEG